MNVATILAYMCAGVCIFCGGGVFATELAGREARPNIMLIVAEDMGLQLGCYGDDTVSTPRLDGMAAQGICFENAYVTQASCSPSRASILTGLYPHENNQLGLAQMGYKMHRGIPNLPGLLKKCGYRTGIQGKLHVEPSMDFSFDFMGNRAGYDVQAYADSTAEFLKTTGPEPWFLYINFEDCHKGFVNQYKGIPATPVTGSDVTPFPELDGICSPLLLKEMAGYYNGVQRVDAGVGMLLDLLEKKGLAENTIVIFIGDHGPAFSRAKTTTYELGVHIPFIVRWPGAVRAGASSDALVSTVDILPTLVDFAGQNLPQPLSGASLRELLTTDSDTAWRQTLVTEWHTHIPGFQPQRSIRDSRYKLILNLRTDMPKTGREVDRCVVGRVLDDPALEGTDIKRVFDMLKSPPSVELYDLKTDPIEYKNLAGAADYKEIQDRLLRELQTWRETTCDPFLDPDVFYTYRQYHDEYERLKPERIKQVKPNKQGIRWLKIDMRPFQYDWAGMVTERYKIDSVPEAGNCRLMAAFGGKTQEQTKENSLVNCMES